MLGGADLIEVQGNRLDLKWIGEDGVIRDQFTMMKNINKKSVIHLKKGESVLLSASFVGDYEWNNQEKTKSIEVKPSKPKTEFTVRDKYNCVQDTFVVVLSK